MGDLHKKLRKLTSSVFITSFSAEITLNALEFKSLLSLQSRNFSRALLTSN